jgi:hypothetical protein
MELGSDQDNLLYQNGLSKHNLVQCFLSFYIIINCSPWSNPGTHWGFRAAQRISRVMPIFFGAGSASEKCGRASQPHHCRVGVRAEPGGHVYGTVRRRNQSDPDGRYPQERQRQQLSMAAAGRHPDTWRLVSRNGYEPHYFGKYVKII